MTAVRPVAIASLVILGALLSMPAFSELPDKIASLSSAKRADLSESYYLAGLQYREVGKLDMAEGMTKLAFALNPSLAPDAISEPTRPTTDQLPLPKLAETIDIDSDTAWTSQVMISRLLLLASAILAENADEVVATMDGSVYLASPGKTALNVTRAQAYAALMGLFERVSLAGLTLTEIYDTSSILVEPYTKTEGALSKAFQVSLTALADLSTEVPFWAAEQRFVLRPVGSIWVVSAVLFGAVEHPPAEWSPAAVEPAITAEKRRNAAETREREAAERQSAADVLLLGAARFLDKDADGMLELVEKEIFLPDGSSLSWQSLRERIVLYFSRTPYRGLRARDVITVDSTELLESTADGTVRYQVEISFEDRYQEALPSIRPGQRFELQNTDGRWLVVAIS